MKFEHLISAFLAEPWAIQREKLGVLADVLVARAEGEKLFSSEYAASIDEARAKEIAESSDWPGYVGNWEALADLNSCRRKGYC